MPPAEVERLKREWTGRRVTVAAESPTLRRFAGHHGTVVTLNMNGRALVRFDGTADIGWYDIPLPDLRPVASPPPAEQTAPLPPGEPPVTSATQPETKPPASECPATPPTGKKLSPLELARLQGAAKRP